MSLKLSRQILPSPVIVIYFSEFSYYAMFRLDEAKKSAADTREKIERQSQQLSNYEAEMKLLRQRGDNWENEREKNKGQIDTLQDTVSRARVVSIVSLFPR